MLRSIVALLLVAFFLRGATVHAAEFVCAESFVPGASTLGNAGFVSLQTSTEAHCAGTVHAAQSLCTAGATFQGCSTQFAYTETALLEVARGLREAATSGSQVQVWTGTCKNSGTNNCATIVNFYGH